MKKFSFISYFISTMAVLLATSWAEADKNTSSYPISRVIGVNAVDGNLEIVTNVIYPNGCFQGHHTYAQVSEAKVIELTHAVDIYDGMCTQALVDVFPTVELSKPAAGVYQIWDTTSERYLGEIYIADTFPTAARIVTGGQR